MEKKGDISITVIIVAAIALIVLVVLVMVFTGRIGLFKEGVGEVSNKELVNMRWKYGDCQPSTAAESDFLSGINKAGEDETIKDTYRSDFNKLVDTCRAKRQADCVSPCAWKK